MSTRLFPVRLGSWLAVGLFAVSLAACGGGGGGGGSAPPAPANPGLTPNFTAQGVLFVDGGNGGSASPQIVTSGFYNNDAFLDFAVANSTNNNISVFFGQGNGLFSNDQIFASTNSGPIAIGSGDFNADGFTDLAVAGQTQISVHRNDGGGNFATRFDYNVGNQLRGLTVGDFDGVNGLDIAVTDSSDDSMWLALNDGSNTFFFNAFNFPSGGSLQNPRALVAGNFDGAAGPDLAVANFGAATAAVWLNSGNVNDLFPAGNSFTVALPSGSAMTVAAGDLTGDGVDDLAVPTIDGNNAMLRTFANDGSANFTIGSTRPISPDSFGSGIADFNLDGFRDPVAGSAFGVNNNGTGEANLLLGNGNGTVNPVLKFALSPNQSLRSLAIGDFNNDGKPDIITATGGTAELLLNTSN